MGQRIIVAVNIMGKIVGDPRIFKKISSGTKIIVKKAE